MMEGDQASESIHWQGEKKGGTALFANTAEQQVETPRAELRHRVKPLIALGGRLS